MDFKKYDQSMCLINMFRKYMTEDDRKTQLYLMKNRPDSLYYYMIAIEQNVLASGVVETDGYEELAEHLHNQFMFRMTLSEQYLSKQKHGKERYEYLKQIETRIINEEWAASDDADEAPEPTEKEKQEEAERKAFFDSLRTEPVD